MQSYSGQIICIYNAPTWVRVLHFSALLLIGCALLTESHQLVKLMWLWEMGIVGKFVVVFISASLLYFVVFQTWVVIQPITIFTSEMIYKRVWVGYKQITYQSISKIYYSRDGSILFFLDGPSTINVQVAPGKIYGIIEAVKLSGSRAEIFG